MTMARTAASASAARMPSAMAAYISARMAFFFSGRLNRTSATPSLAR